MICLWQIWVQISLFKMLAFQNWKGDERLLVMFLDEGCLVKLTEAQGPMLHEVRHTGHSNLVTACSCTPMGRHLSLFHSTHWVQPAPCARFTSQQDTNTGGIGCTADLQQARFLRMEERLRCPFSGDVWSC